MCTLFVWKYGGHETVEEEDIDRTCVKGGKAFCDQSRIFCFIPRTGVWIPEIAWVPNYTLDEILPVTAVLSTLTC